MPARTPPRLARAPLLLLALAACEPRGGPPTPAQALAPRPSDGPTPRSRTRPALRSCPATAKPLTVKIDPRIELGEAAGVTWLFGYVDSDAVLVHLATDGGLAPFKKVPLHNAQVGAIAGDEIWLYAPRESDTAPTRWITIDVSDPDAPIVGPIVPLSSSLKSDYAQMLAVDARRAVLIVGSPDDNALLLLDPTTHTAIARPHPLGKGFEPVHAMCADDRCAVVGVTNEGGGPERRLVVIRVLADGTREQELLAPGWIGQPHAGEHGDQLLVTWTDHDGLRMRVLDLWGRPAGPVIPVPRARERRNDTLLHADGVVMLAVGERGRWEVAALGPNSTPGPFRELPGARGHFLAGAPLGDGLAWVSVEGDVSYDEMGPGMMSHSWHSRAVGGFLPSSGAPTQRDLASGRDGGRGGFQALVLVRPGAAAALVIPRDDAHDSHQPVFAPLRAPCPA